MKKWKLWKRAVSFAMSAVLLLSSAAAYARTEQTSEDGIGVTAEADADGFVIENGVLTGYTGTAAEIVIPDSVTSIGYRAFYQCKSLTKVTIPASVTSIEEGAFYDCDGLTEVTIPASITSIGDSVFYGCRSLTRVTIPASVTSIGDGAFSYCSSLEKVSIPDSVTSIEEYAFTYCSSLTIVTIPASVTSIGDMVFHGCSNKLTIYCKEGSDAETYAKKNALSFVPLFKGDFDIDMGQTDFIYKKGSSEGATIKCFGEREDFQNVSVDGEPINEKDYTLKEEEDSTIIKFSLEFMDTLEEGKYSFTLNYKENRKVEMTMTITGSAAAGFVIDENGVLVSYEPKNIFPEEIEIPDIVTSIGDGVFEGESSIKKIIIPDSVKSIGKSAFSRCGLTEITIPESVESIGESAFADCDGLTEVTVPGRVESIGDSAFSSCDKLTTVTMQDGVKSIGRSAFFYCQKLTNVKLPESLTSIGNRAFEDCTGLAEVEIPKNVTKLGNLEEIINTGSGIEVLACAFSGCSSLTNIKISPENKIYASVDGCVYTKDKKRLLLCPQGKSVVNIPEGVTSIESHAFYNCMKLTEVTISESVESIQNSAFNYCGLKEVTIPGNVKSIGDFAFYSCSGLTKVTMLEGVTDIGSVAFSGCSNLEEVAIPESVTHFGSDAFMGTKWLAKQREESPRGLVIVSHILLDGQTFSEEVLVIPNDVTLIADSAFKNSKSLKEVTIPGSVKSIGQSAFESCVNLTKVTMQEGVESIGRYAFMFCTGLVNDNDIIFPKSIISIGASAFHGTRWLDKKWAEKKLIIINHVLMDGRSVDGEVVIPDGVTTISDFAFSSNDTGEEGSLTGVTIPRSVTSIGEYTFEGCKYLKKVTILGSETKLGREVFLGCSDVTIYGGAGTYAEEYAKEYDIHFEAIPVIQEAQTDAVYVKGSAEGATIKCTGDLKDFKGVSVDGEPIKESSYTLEEGSTIINFTQAFMDTLKDGEHTFVLKYEGDWTVEMTMTVTSSVIGGVIGDVDGDGTVTADDALEILKSKAGLIELNATAKKMADVNADGIVDADDALDILKKKAGLLDNFKAEA